MNTLRTFFIVLVISTSTNANVFYDVEDWVEGAWGTVWNWAEHNPGLAIVSSVAIIGVTEPIILSEAAMTVIAPVYGTWTQFTEYVAENTVSRASARYMNTTVDRELYLEMQATLRGDAVSVAQRSRFALNANNPAYSRTSWIMQNGAPTRMPLSEVTAILPHNPVEIAALGGVMSALIIGVGYVGYNMAADGLDWSEDTLNSGIIKINNGACWLANGAYDDCKDFLITELKVEDENDTDNSSFFKQDIHKNEDFMIDNMELVF